MMQNTDLSSHSGLYNKLVELAIIVRSLTSQCHSINHEGMVLTHYSLTQVYYIHCKLAH